MLPLLASFAIAGPAAPDLDKGVHIHLERTIAASADETWQFFAEDFAGIGAWANGLQSRPLAVSDVPAAIPADDDAPVPGRIVDDGKRDQVHVLVDFDRQGRTFTFRAGNPPGVLAYAHNQHTIVDLADGRSRVDIDVVIVPRGIAKLLKGTIEKKFTAYMVAYLDDAEAGLTSAVADGGVR